MTGVTRRDSIRLGGSALAALALPACTGNPTAYPPAPIEGHLIDAHCHVFNGTDLPITTFLTRLALPGYDPQTCEIDPDISPRARGAIDDPDLVESSIELLVSLLLSATPTAQAELARLKTDRNGTLPGEQARVRARTLNGLSRFLAEPPAAEASLRAQRRDTLRDALWQEAGVSQKELALRSTAPRKAAARLLISDGTFGRLYPWVSLFFRSRESLAQELISATHHWGRDPLMLVPLMVDYTHWLGQTTDCKSALPDQVAVYGELARRSFAPIHAMVAYDPLRAVFWASGKRDRFPTPEFDPLALARTAVTQHGFVGLKVYPPMGFQATGNSNADADYPAAVIKALEPDGTLGTSLDRAMRQAIDLCVELDVPILAHTNNSLAAGSGYGARAAPRYWIEALQREPRLRLCLAHAGHFCWRDTSAPPGTPASRSSWEWAIARHIRAHPNSHLYIDISYLSEPFASERAKQLVTKRLKDWIDHCDREVRHILFGTDWTMLGKEPEFGTYGTRVMAFLKDDLNLTYAQIERVLWQNAMRYLGLDSGQSRDRLLRFYNGRRPPWTEVPLSALG